MPKKYLLFIIFILITYIGFQQYQHVNLKTSLTNECLSDGERLSLIKNIINNSSNESLNINTDDVKIENIYTININGKNLVVFHDTNSDFHFVNFMIFEEKDLNLNLMLHKCDIFKFSVCNPSFFLLETRRMGRGTGVASADYLLYDYDFNLAWVGENYLLEASMDGSKLFKAFSYLNFRDNYLYHGMDQITLINDIPIEFEEVDTEFEYKNNKFIESHSEK